MPIYRSGAKDPQARWRTIMLMQQLGNTLSEIAKRRQQQRQFDVGADLKAKALGVDQDKLELERQLLGPKREYYQSRTELNKHKTRPLSDKINELTAPTGASPQDIARAERAAAMSFTPETRATIQGPSALERLRSVIGGGAEGERASDEAVMRHLFNAGMPRDYLGEAQFEAMLQMVVDQAKAGLEKKYKPLTPEWWLGSLNKALASKNPQIELLKLALTSEFSKTPPYITEQRGYEKGDPLTKMDQPAPSRSGVVQDLLTVLGGEGNKQASTPKPKKPQLNEKEAALQKRRTDQYQVWYAGVVKKTGKPPSEKEQDDRWKLIVDSLK